MSDPTTEKTDSAAFAEAWDAPQKSALAQAEIDRMTDDIIEALKSVFDPEIPVDIYELGLIYKVDLSDDRDVVIEMTLTAPGCPVAGEMPLWVEQAVMKVDGVRSARAELTFDPPWDPSKMSDEAKLALNMF
ncbi:MAG: SUF system Fe-S cluster assembly protein [Alphaproteobacteria bacterium]|uniref:SUF system Fe-S cluster assembly protein n=1 Tax=Brevundimonas sp. TaxID=1871086 RepID=UPI0012026089|nr:SUF system Fe-S cluster assembly protein [Brevundimonas sp.]MBU3972203.1 SUF system Fe-S cluster assembly protein [Alphaproteobacteria bacterium]MBU4040174.1 SUF system Fe-S cluster assembly protein [Alphaproteobacteria bacterium]MBU4136947.1 SUF system Fe-S cluster assembly protein [Alphaproteobacteria bacterium]TAJ62112.1 MAG: SUF system Fe-S cluster assembly protein [Brevundimonas sp.]